MLKKVSGEFERIDILNSILHSNDGNGSKDKYKGIISGREFDDAALIPIDNESSLVVASDFIRGTGFYLFQLGLLDYYDVGYYLIIANISDIAAMGALPIALTTNIRYSKNVSDEEFANVFMGIKDAAEKYRVPVVGGDIGGYDVNVFTATALGKVKTNNALLRKNVKNDDLLCVTGQVGTPITALTYFKKVRNEKKIFDNKDEEKLLDSWKRPEAKINEGALLSSSMLCNGCMDISDGLAGSIHQLTKSTGVTFTIYEEKVPICKYAKLLAERLMISPSQLAFSSSVDFQLLFTISKSDISECKRLFSKNNYSFTVIGETNDCGINKMIDKENKEVDLPGIPWVQQSGDYLKDIIRRK